MDWRHRTTRMRTLHNNTRLDKSGERRKRLERPRRIIRGEERVREASTLSLFSYYWIGAPGTNHLVLAAPIQVANAKCKMFEFLDSKVCRIIRQLYQNIISRPEMCELSWKVRIWTCPVAVQESGTCPVAVQESRTCPVAVHEHRSPGSQVFLKKDPSCFIWNLFSCASGTHPSWKRKILFSKTLGSFFLNHIYVLIKKMNVF